MPIFDNPDRELNRLQQSLLEEEELEELVEEFGEEDYEDCFQEDYEEETQEIFYRNHANGYGADIRNFANGYRGEALLEEEEDYEEEVYRKNHRRRSGRGLLVLVIFGALVYFVLRRMGIW